MKNMEQALSRFQDCKLKLKPSRGVDKETYFFWVTRLAGRG